VYDFQPYLHVLASFRYPHQLFIISKVKKQKKYSILHSVFPSQIQILKGFQIIWLVCVIIPILSVPLLHIPKEKGLMTRLPGKMVDLLVVLTCNLAKNVKESFKTKKILISLIIRLIFAVFFSIVIFTR
jgi:hypothetical protein